MNVMIARKKKHLTQEELCKKVGISTVTLSKIENGKDSNVTKALMLKLSEMLEESVEYLFFSED